ncbi:bis-aminopropyl spermidine synthase family protein [Actinorugispora endophytica]|uniref:Uncharacterized protein DUF43 n=1 Tax=Actinorugispora endophytica TaxID=1605990 RepID=A0A4R6UQP2_9ACTN|nr:bis-aminopropyl spermidine synthase family protein [Actinorugispora endophytica]TDQ48526.1 uncharacterized protein DUF43 [Actinorugispora endophytica]
MTTDLPPALSALLKEQGADAARVLLIPAALSDGRWWSARELVRSTGVAHRVVAATLDALGDELERDGDRVRPRDPSRYAPLAERPRLADPVGHLLAPHAAAEAELERLVAGAPAARADLDHVAASARTALRRAVFLGARFDLDGARLLCVGDHDLTSLALTLVHPGAEAVVVDIDERMLAYIDAAADRLGLKVRCHFADLRLGLPPAVRSGSDLVFTDPPYTPEGVELFVRRGLEGLAEPRTARVLVAYGASETTPALAARTQERLTRLNLAVEAIWPDFNHYLGAEAIGAASDLYVLRATARTPVGDGGGRAGSRSRAAARIYSQGVNARESADALTAGTAPLVWAGTAPDAFVGAWPEAALPEGANRVPLAAWLSAPVPAGHAVVDLTAGGEALTERVLLAAPAAELSVVVGSRAPQVRDEAGQAALRRVAGPDRTVRFARGVPDPRRTVVRVGAAAPGPGVADDAGAWLARHVRERAHGSVAAALREGLIRAAAGLGAPVNKKWARTRVAAAAPWLSGHTLMDLPLHRLLELDAVASRLAGELPGAH